jgi:integration host factor subunit beta
MNRSRLIELLAQEADITLKKTEEIVDVVFDTMGQALINDQRIEIRGFGNFMVRKYDGYIGRNPKTGEKIQVPPKKLPFFKVGKGLKERVDK